LAEIISSDVALLVTFNQAIDGVIKNNQKAKQDPKALAQLAGYTDRWWDHYRRISEVWDGDSAKVESLQETIEEIGENETTSQ
jgi:hypothetical protein